MILSDTKILEEIKKGTIVIDPFDISCLGSNSYDVHLGETIAIYQQEVLDSMKHNSVNYITIPDKGLILLNGCIYLGITKEYTETYCHVPFLEGKSSVGRPGLNIHAPAGKGDVGFCNYWTLEISVHQPVKVYKNMEIGQLIYFECSGEIKTTYDKKVSAKYNIRSNKPIESMMWKNFIK